jgi:glycosyltransferase involved in cell wall biosynthesis
MRLTIAMPAFDEVANLARAVEEARGAAQRAFPGESEILIVDDGSRDGTAEVADALAARWSDVRVVRHAGNRGFSGAMATCFQRAQGEWVFLAAADGQTDMQDLAQCLALSGAAEIVVGVRVRRTEGTGRKLLSRGFHLIARMLLALPEREFSSVFLFRRSLLAEMRFRASPRSAVILPEILFRARQRDARIVELPVSPRPRWAGRAKGGQISVALITLVELVRVAALARWDEARRDLRRPALGPTTDPLA